MLPINLPGSLLGKVVDDVLVTLHGVTRIPQGDHSILGPIRTATVEVEGTTASAIINMGSP